MNAQPSDERPLRADAERNRKRILAAATEVFAARGLDASLDQIAAHAGVGVGTVYRRFTDKDALIDQLFEERIGEVAAAAERGLEHEDPWQGFEVFMHEACALQAADRGLRGALLSRGRGRERVELARNTMAPLVQRLVERARRDGRLRDDLDTFDVPIVQLMLSAVVDATGDIAPEVWRRFLVLVIDGMRQSREAPTPLPAKPLDREQIAMAMERHKFSTRRASTDPPPSRGNGS